MGLGEKSTIEWSDTNRRKAELEPAKKEIEAIRERWADLANEKLLEHGHEIRIDHRSLAAQGIEREPTVHLGPAVSGMERRGIETEVGKRLDRQALEAAQERLERAAELGKVMRETRELTASIIDVSGNIESAKRERDLMLAKSQELEQPKPSIEDLQRQGRERWAAMRAEQLAKEQAKEQTPEQGIDKGAEKSHEPQQGRELSSEERQRQAAERWLEYRRNQELNKGQEPSRSQEHEGPEKDRGLEHDGFELE